MKKKVIVFLTLLLNYFVLADSYEIVKDNQGNKIRLWANRTWEYNVDFIRVIDGDTLLVNYKGKDQEIDLYLVDAPEKGQPYGDKAVEYLEKLFKDKNILLRVEESYGVGNFLHIYFKDGGYPGFLEEMVEQGLAWVNPEFSTGLSMQIEDEAKRAWRGLWKERSPIPPWIWREEHQNE